MQHYFKKSYQLYFLLITLLFFLIPTKNLWAQFPRSTLKENGLLFHGIEQYEQSHYSLAAQTLQNYLDHPKNPVTDNAALTNNSAQEKARYYLLLSQIKNEDPVGIAAAERGLSTMVNPDYKTHIAYNLGEYYFGKSDFKRAILFLKQVNINFLDNEQIVDQKFELAYSYFYNNQFDKAGPLFAAIKDLPNNKYYVAGNYYYGLLAYNDKDYKEALKSFKRIDKEPTYKDVVPYYEAEIYYFMGDFPRVLAISKPYLKQDSLYYNNDMVLLTAQTLFEGKRFEEALPYFERYYNHTNKIRKEDLYEMAYCYYQLKQWPEAINRFQPLSSSNDSLGQTAMYLLGDCYLKANNKKGARSSFGICANMDFNSSQKEDAAFLYAKLSDELGYTTIATNSLYAFIKNYPNSTFSTEAKTELSNLLVRSNNYSAAFDIMSHLPVKSHQEWLLYQRVAVGRALQELQNGSLQMTDSILNLSLQQPYNLSYEAIAYFWKGEIAYRQGKYDQAIVFSQSFLKKSVGIADNITAISKEATTQNAQMNIGYAQMKTGDYSNAGQAFAQAKKEGGENTKTSASASLNEADAYFMQKDYKKAKQLYQDAITKGTDQADYARYHISLLDGLLGNEASQKEQLKEIIDQEPPSLYHDKAEYDLYFTYLNEGNLTSAIQGFEKIEQQSQSHPELMAKSLIKLAYAYQLNGETEKAINSYQKFLLTYPGDSSRSIAIEALSSLYVAQGQPEKFIAFLKDNNLPTPDEAILENTFYDAAIQDFNKDKWTAAIQGFSKYLQNFPMGKNAVKTHFYRGLANEKAGNKNAAVADFDSVLKAGWSEFAEGAASSGARIAFNQANYDTAYQFYGQLRNVTVNAQMLQIAYEGLMKSAFNLSEYRQSSSFADTLLSLPNLSKNLRTQGQLFKARSLQENKDFDSATVIYKTLDTANIGAISAEARYRIAEISFMEGHLKDAEKQAGYAVQSSSGQDYWVVKCYLLLGDILTEEKDYFNAKATLASIVRNTKIASLKKEAAEKLEAVKALEKKNSKLKED